jgi:hypothetical protein
MNQSIKKYLLISQLCILVALTICLILMPHFLFAKNEGGVSNYGIHLKTVVPYSLGFLIAAFYVIRAAGAIETKSPKLRRLRELLLGYSVILLLVLITTYSYKVNLYLKDTHIGVTILTFWFEFLGAFWLCKVFLRDKLNIGFLAFQFIGLIMGSLTFLGFFHLLFTAQLITILSFGIIMVRSASIIPNDNGQEKGSLV